MTFSAVIVAAGSGSRAGHGPAKQWRDLAGKPVIRWSVETFLASGAERVVVVIRPEDSTTARDALAGLPRIVFQDGGERRPDSVRNGLGAAGDVASVLVHDAARPLLQAAHVEAVLAALQDHPAAIPVLPVADTLKRRDGRLITVPRDGLMRAQTPQGFHRTALLAAYAALPADADVTDDAEVFERFGGAVATVPGDQLLFKLTYPEDFAMAQALAAGHRITRTGSGFDAHQLGPGDAVWLCGVRIDHDGGLVGHSDADVGLHALTDAVLGAIGAGDIGDHFPPTDPRWKGAASDQFLAHAAGLVAERGGRIVGVDVTLICEAPKVKPHRQAMRERIAAILALPVDRVSVKATTTEGMGFTGRREGIAAQAVANVETPA